MSEGWSLASLVYLLVLGLLLPFGLHRLRLVWLRLRRAPPVEARTWPGPLPVVTVQLPVFNEATVVERLVDAACRLDWPRDRLEIQVLDDSTDETTALAAARAARWRARGLDVRHLRRADRRGFKAGALAAGARRARGEFFLVLDADFVPPPDLVRRLLPPFADPSVGAVQAAWGHLNAEEGWLTRAQALFLDAHFAVEHGARYRAGLFFNFNGTAGMWRRRCVEEAGGWQADTLTEDLDLSYRAQLAGWRFAFREDVAVPAELPGDLRALELQQARWAQGGIQTAAKLLPRVWRSDLRPAVKWEATAHLLGHAVHPLTLLLGVALCAIGWAGGLAAELPGWVHGGAFALATVPFLVFYTAALRLRPGGTRRDPSRGPDGWGMARRGPGAARRIVEALALGIGLGVPLTFAVARGLAGARTPFRRTPKRGAAGPWRYAAPAARGPEALRAALGLAVAGATASLVAEGLLAPAPFTGLFAFGYLATTGGAVARGGGGARSRSGPRRPGAPGPGHG